MCRERRGGKREKRGVSISESAEDPEGEKGGISSLLRIMVLMGFAAAVLRFPEVPEQSVSSRWMKKWTGVQAKTMATSLHTGILSLSFTSFQQCRLQPVNGTSSTQTL